MKIETEREHKLIVHADRGTQHAARRSGHAAPSRSVAICGREGTSKETNQWMKQGKQNASKMKTVVIGTIIRRNKKGNKETRLSHL